MRNRPDSVLLLNQPEPLSDDIWTRSDRDNIRAT